MTFGDEAFRWECRGSFCDGISGLTRGEVKSLLFLFALCHLRNKMTIFRVREFLQNLTMFAPPCEASQPPEL
jgi:hypothetical protein